MRKIKKFFYVLHDIITIILVIVLFAFIMGGRYSNDFINYLLKIQSIRYTLAVLTCIVALISFIKLVRILLKKREDRYLLLFRDDGDIEISDLAIEKIVLNSLLMFREIVEKDVRIKIKNGQNEDYKIIVDIKCGLDEELLKKDVLVSKDLSNIKKDSKIKELEKPEEVSEVSEEATIKIDKFEVVEPEQSEDLERTKKIEEIDEGNLDEVIEETQSPEVDPNYETKDIEIAEKVEDCVKEEVISLYEDKIYRQIQSYIHRNIVAFLGVKIDRVGIKFYYTKRKNSSNRKHFDEKKKRVN